MNIQSRFLSAVPLAVALLLTPGAVSAQNAQEKFNAALKRVYGQSALGVVQSATLDEKQAAAAHAASGFRYGPAVRYYKVTVGSQGVGYAIVDEVKGKAKLITYTVMVDNNLIVKDLEVLAYREPYGGEIQYDSFRKQFRGKGPRDAVKVGVNIRNISGATISSNAVTNGTRKLLAVLQQLKQGGKLL